jgi:uncharacterized protein YcaQ
VLRVRAAFGEDRTFLPVAPGPDEVAAELAAELALMAGWMGLAAGVVVETRGDLAEHLVKAVAAAPTG